MKITNIILYSTKITKSSSSYNKSNIDHKVNKENPPKPEAVSI